MNLLVNQKGSKSFFSVWISTIVFFALFVIFPLLCVAFTPKLNDFATVFSSSQYLSTILNTAIECVCSTTLSVLIGYIYAYAVVRCDIPFKNIFAKIPIIHLVTPPFVGGLAFILLVGRQGFVTKTLLGLDVSLYGFWGLLLAQVLCFFPMSYLICKETLESINPSLEQAARGMGASHFGIFVKITLPLSLPGIASAFLFVAVSVLSDFGNPLIVAGRFKVLAVEIYTQLTGWLNSGVSAILGFILLLPSVLLFILQRKLLQKNASKVATIGGKSSSLPRKQSSPLARVLLTIFCVVIAFSVVAQFLAIIAGSFQTLWGIKTDFTLKHIQSVSRFSKELFSSLGFSLISAICATLIAGITSYIVHRTNAPLRRFLDATCQLPAAIPGSLLGLSLLLASNLIGIRIPRFFIALSMIVAFLPFSYRIISTFFAQVKTSLDEAAMSLGASKIKVFTSVLLPLSKESLFSSFIYDFVRGVGTVSAVIFLVSFDTPLASISILNLAEQGDWGKACALALVLTLISFIILGVGKLIFTFFFNNSSVFLKFDFKNNKNKD